MDPVRFGNQDWSKLDSSRWNLQDLGFGEGVSPMARLVQQLFISPQQQQDLAANLTRLKESILQGLQEKTRLLQDRAAGLDKELAERIAATRQQITALQEVIRTSEFPVSVAADPNKFQLVIKALDQRTRLGLPGLEVRLIDPRSADRILTKGTTGLDGNAVLSLIKDQAEALVAEKTDLVVAIFTLGGITLHRGDQAITPRPGQSQTYVASLPSSTELAPHLDLASRFKSERESRQASLTARIDQLQTAYHDMQQDITSQLDDIKGMTDGINAELKPQ